jgi:hypothetical protein
VILLPSGISPSSDPFQSETWLSVDDIVGLGRARRKVLVNLTTGRWTSRVVGKGRNGKAVYQVALASLPEGLQHRWAERLERTAVPEAEIEHSYAEADDGLTQLTQALSGYSEAERDAWVAEALRLNEIMNRYEAIIPKRARTVDGRLDFVPAVRAICLEAVCTNEIILSALASRSRRGSEAKQRTKQISAHTLDEWARKRKRLGLRTFIRSKAIATKPDDGRCAKISPAAKVWLESRWRRYPIVTQLYIAWAEAARKNHWHIPSLAWLQRRWQAIPPVAKAAIFKGDKFYTDKYKPFLARTVEDLAALQLLCGDHHVLDVFCWSEKLKALVRLWLTAWQDMRTGVVWGTHLDYTPSSFTIGCAYANGVRTFGAQPPSREDLQSYIYTDNGKDYRSQNVKGEIEVHQRAGAITGGLELLLTQRGVGLVNDANIKQLLARNYNGREKPLERTFRDLADFIQTEFFQSGWCGRNTKDKPDSCRELYIRHQKAIKRGAASPFPSEHEVRIKIAEWIHRYNTSAHSVAAELPVEVVAEERLPIAVGQNQATVHLFNRLDAKRHRAPVGRIVTAIDVAGVEADDSIFGETAAQSRVKEFDFDE